MVVDQVLTDTTDYAHVFLPTTTFLEEEDMLVSWGHNIIGGVNRVIEPVGEARSDLSIFQQLADRLGIGPEMAGAPRDWLSRIFTPLTRRGVSIEQVMEGAGALPGGPHGAVRGSRLPDQVGPLRVHHPAQATSRAWCRTIR